jgi:NAD(P)-dependent dehydrogenase (short-subunit alcohol dehydrogenase family)
MGTADIRLDGTVAIVTGAARGLGQAMATGLLHAGANVVFADIDGDALAAATRAVADQPNSGTALAMRCDITRQDDCERVIGETLAKFGALHVLVNNAAMGQVHIERSPKTKSLKFWESDPDIWQQVIVTNVNGTFLMARSAAPAMLRGGFGRIINVTTSLATMQRRNNSPYGVTKAAIEAETLIWAQELKDTDVTVNSLIPGGAADTDFRARSVAQGIGSDGPCAAIAIGDGAADTLARVATVGWNHRRAFCRQAVGRHAAAERSRRQSTGAVCTPARR